MTRSTSASADSGRFEVDGCRLEYRWLGRSGRESTTLVLLHEGLGCVAMWKDFPQVLHRRTGLPVFLYSRAGYGGSDPAELPRAVDYMHREALQVLPRVLHRAGIARAVLVGHSDGGSIALIHAGSPVSRVPGAVPIEALVLLAAHVFNEPMCVDSIRAARRQYQAGPRLRRALSRFHGEQVDAAFHGWNDIWLHPDFRAWNIEDSLGGLACPSLVIQGRQDEYGSLDQVDAIERGAPAPVRRVILEDCGHSPQFDQPLATVEAIAGFLADLGLLDGAARPVGNPRAAEVRS